MRATVGTWDLKIVTYSPLLVHSGFSLEIISDTDIVPPE